MPLRKTVAASQSTVSARSSGSVVISSAAQRDEQLPIERRSEIQSAQNYAHHERAQCINSDDRTCGAGTTEIARQRHGADFRRGKDGTHANHGERNQLHRPQENRWSSQSRPSSDGAAARFLAG